MSGYNNYSDQNEDLEELAGTAGNGLRAQLEKVLAKNQELVQRLEAKDRQAVVDEAVRNAGVNPGVASLIPGDANPSEWVEANKHLFGAVAVTPADDLQPEVIRAIDSDPAVIAEKQAQAAMQDARESGAPAVTQTDIDRVKGMTQAELLAAIKGSQALTG